MVFFCFFIDRRFSIQYSIQVPKEMFVCILMRRQCAPGAALSGGKVLTALYWEKRISVKLSLCANYRKYRFVYLAIYGSC